MKSFSQNRHHKRTIAMILALAICCPILFSGTGCSCSDPRNSKARQNALLFSSLIFPKENGPIHISVSTSRVSGVAPLSVFFDATGTTGLGFASSVLLYDSAFMDATFAWDFDADNADPDGKYEKASGFVAAHVFEHPGTYRVHLDVYDALGETASTDIAVTVSEFSGPTYYVAADGSDSNSGTDMAYPFSTAQHALTGPHVQPNTRILFKRGDTFHTPYFEAGPHDGPVIVDSYEDPAEPSDAAPVIYSPEVDNAYATAVIYADDWRLMNIAVRSGGSSFDGPRYPTGISLLGSHNLKYRTTEYYLGQVSFNISGQYNTIAECEAYYSQLGAYSSAQNGINDGNALIGNHLHDQIGTPRGPHTFRLQGGSRFFIAHNQFGPNLESIGYDALTIRGNTEKVVVYKNVFYGWVQKIGPQNQNSAREYQHHCIMDSNLFIGPGMIDGDRDSAIRLDSKDIVIRNNIIYNYSYGVSINNDTVVGPSQRIKIYNNTFVNPSRDSGFTFLVVEPECSAINSMNNLMLDLAGGRPEYTSFICLDGAGVFPGTSDHNLVYGGSNWGADHDDLYIVNERFTLATWQSSTGNDLHSSIADPLLVSTDSTNVHFCMPQAGSPLIDAGEFTPAALDYYGNFRDSSRDIGACEYH